MRNFGSLGGRVSRGLRTQSVLRNYPSPVYLQRDTGFPYGTYGAASAPTGAGNQNVTSVYQPETNKWDMLTALSAGVTQIGDTAVKGAYAKRGVDIYDPYTATSGTSTTSGGSSSGLLIGLAVAAVAVGGLAFFALR